MRCYRRGNGLNWSRILIGSATVLCVLYLINLKFAIQRRKNLLELPSNANAMLENRRQNDRMIDRIFDSVKEDGERIRKRPHSTMKVPIEYNPVLKNTPPLSKKHDICPELAYPQNVADTQIFQSVAHDSRNGVFSAFRSTGNDRTSIRVQVIGYCEKTFSTFCQIWSTDGTLIVVKSRDYIIPETHGTRFSPVWYYCPIPKNFSTYTVSVVTKECDKPLNILPVINAERPADGVYAKKFTVCVSPFSKSYKRSYELIEKIELDSMFGADYFVFYNYSVGKYTDKILDYYANKGRAEVVQWKIPLNVDTWPAQPEIHYYGQLVSLNDCVYRNARKSRYIVVTDLDEIIVPMLHRNWSEMLDSIINTTNSNVFVFRCIFFRKEWSDYPDEFPEKQIAKKYNIMSLLKMRSEAVKGFHERPKTILDPSFVDTTGVHEVHASKAGIQIYRVPPETGLEFHYRDWDNPNDPNKLPNTRMLKYASEIADRISHVWGELSSMIPLPANCSC